jgi:hypothetical protein
MTDTEDWVRAALHDISAESRPVPLLGPLMRRRAAERRRRRITVAGAAAATMAAILVGALVAGYHPTTTPEPAQQPPKSFHLTDTSSPHPGPARMVVTFTSVSGVADTPAYVVPVTTGRAVRLAQESRSSTTVRQQRLSANGRVLLQLRGFSGDGTVVLTNLVTGHERRVANPHGADAELSPDGTTLALRDDTNVTLVDVATGRARPLRPVKVGDVPGAQVGWSPDSRLLAVEDITATLVVDLGGQIRARLSGMSLIDGSQSWSPDGKSLLVYDGSHPGLRVVPVSGGPGLDVRPPSGAVRALGWTGDRVVWLAGRPGSQRLVTTDVLGGTAAVWMRFDVGEHAVASVTWSRALSG